MEHVIHRKWDKYFVVAKHGDTYESIALEFSKKLKDILDYNDITDRNARPREGERICLSDESSASGWRRSSTATLP